jgi:uncharacterized protein DUF4386
MDSNKKTARRAGLLYFLASLLGLPGLIFVPGKLFVRGDVVATADNIRNNADLLHFGIASELVSSLLFIWLVLVLYRLFKPVSEKHARAMALLILLSMPITMIAVLNEVAASLLATGDNLAAFGKPQLDSLAYVFMRLHGRGYALSEIFWGLWLFPFGILVLRSGFIPRFLGYLLLIAPFGYLAGSINSLLLSTPLPLLDRIESILAAAELPIIFWLLIWGVKKDSASLPVAVRT